MITFLDFLVENQDGDKLKTLLALHDRIADHAARQPGIPNDAHIRDYHNKLDELHRRIVQFIQQHHLEQTFEGNLEAMNHHLMMMHKEQISAAHRGDPGGGLSADDALTTMHSTIGALEWELLHKKGWRY